MAPTGERFRYPSITGRRHRAEQVERERALFNYATTDPVDLQETPPEIVHQKLMLILHAQTAPPAASTTQRSAAR